jgi:hypothetical protein
LLLFSPTIQLPLRDNLRGLRKVPCTLYTQQRVFLVSMLRFGLRQEYLTLSKLRRVSSTVVSMLGSSLGKDNFKSIEEEALCTRPSSSFKTRSTHFYFRESVAQVRLLVANNELLSYFSTIFDSLEKSKNLKN